MAYEFDELQFLKEEGRDWWETLRQVPIKILDQDFGKEVSADIIQLASEPDEQVSKPSEDPGPQYHLDNLKRKEDVVKASGFSQVTFEKNYFQVKIFSNQFNGNKLVAKIQNGFLVISGRQMEQEGDDITVCREFARRYMLPHNCHFVEKNQLEKSSTENSITVKIRNRKLSSPDRGGASKTKK